MTRHDILGATLTVTMLAFLCSMGALAYYVSATEAHDPDSLCPTDRAVSHTVVLVDRTDPLTEEHQRLLSEAIEQAVASLQLYERFSIFLIEGEAPPAPAPVLSVCKPYDGTDANWLYENARLMREDYEERFNQPLSATVANLNTQAEAPQSPIMQIIRSVASLPSFVEADRRRKLIVVSDLLQNTADYSHYKTKPDYRAFRSSPYGATVRPTLDGVEVTLVYLPNRQAQRRQGSAHLRFWEAYFTEAGAAIVQIIPSLDDEADQGKTK